MLFSKIATSSTTTRTTTTTAKKKFHQFISNKNYIISVAAAQHRLQPTALDTKSFKKLTISDKLNISSVPCLLFARSSSTSQQQQHQQAHLSSLMELLSRLKVSQGSGYNHKDKDGDTHNWRLLLSLAFFIPVIYAKHQNENENDYEDDKKTTPRGKFNFIADVVEIIIPSIVQIGIKTPTPYGPMDAASGSGFIVSTDGVILTNAHVVRNHISDINVKLNDGRSFRGRVTKIDRSADLAIIKIDCNDLKPAKLGDSDRVRTGEFVIALGSPLSLNNTVTSGVVSNPNRDGTELGLTNKLSYLQTDTIVTHGNSGGPLINLDGEVVGINTMTAAPGISFAIPSKYALEFLNAKTNSIASKYRYLGMKMISLTPQIYYLFNTQPNSDIRIPDRQGCLVVDVAPNSPAEKAGMKRGDVIVMANDNLVAKNADLFDILKKTPELKLRIVRENVDMNVKVIADEKEG